jgi:hypothetical protein
MGRPKDQEVTTEKTVCYSREEDMPCLRVTRGSKDRERGGLWAKAFIVVNRKAWVKWVSDWLYE